MVLYKCTKCNRLLPDDMFYVNKRTKSRRVSYECKQCCSRGETLRRRTKRGLCNNIYNGHLSSSKKRCHDKPSYSREWLINEIMTHPSFDRLYRRWADSGHDRWNRPSIDRLDDYVGYTKDNIRLTTFKENCFRSHKDRVNGKNTKDGRIVYMYDLDGNYIKEFKSISIAAREIGVTASNIVNACYGRYYMSGGYQWSYIRHRSLDKHTPNRFKKPVVQYDKNGNKINEFISVVEAARHVGLNERAVSAACCGAQKTAGGYIWKHKIN